MKSIVISSFIGCVIALACAYLYLQPALTREKTISCQSRYTLSQNNFKLDANYGFIIGDNKGELTIYGYSIENGVHVNIRRAIRFTYTKIDNVYRLHNTKIESIVGDESEKGNINIHLPAFFNHEGEVLTMQITHDKFNVPVFFVHNMPMFYCKKTG